MHWDPLGRSATSSLFIFKAGIPAGTGESLSANLSSALNMAHTS